MAATATKVGGRGHDMHPFFKVEQIVNGALLSDMEEPHRKRQRTLSPENHPATLSRWQDQLQEAAGELSKRPIPTESNPAEACPNSIVVENESSVGAPMAATERPNLPTDAGTKSDVKKTSPRRMLRVRPDGKLASPNASTESAGSIKGALINDVSRPKRDSISAKTILKLHPDGKLFTSKVENAKEGVKRKGSSKTSKIGGIIKACCVVVMRYGADEDARASIGQKVNNILFGASKEPSPWPNRPAEPAKVTHPFFTTNLNRRTNPKLELQSENEGHGKQASQTRKLRGPTQSRITSKPPTAVDNLSSSVTSAYPTFGTDYAKVTRFPGAQNPLWPPLEMLHVGKASYEMIKYGTPPAPARRPVQGRKLKDAQIQILPEEDILFEMTKLVQFCDSHQKNREVMSRDIRKFRRPCRKIMTSRALQQAICSKVASDLSDTSASKNDKDCGTGTPETRKSPTHEALLYVYKGILHSRAAFDMFRCETQEWVHKYSPKKAEHVLQQGREAVILRDWLQRSITSSYERGTGQSRTGDSSLVGRRGGAKSSRKIKRKARELDDFLVSSDDEGEDMQEILDPGDCLLSSLHERKSVVHADPIGDGERNANAIVLSGPHGCGKTAAVFAVAEELRFEVFEVNAGSRRSGRDVLDRIGDMTRNHLVKHRQDEKVTHPIKQTPKSGQADEDHQAGINIGRQGTLPSLLHPKPTSNASEPHEKDMPRPRLAGFRGEKSGSQKNGFQERMSKPRDQKQSLILLEEVDILFEEDKLFWATVMDLIIKSKRPVVMTCSDESLLPLDEIELFAILRFVSPPASLATDYLLLVAASEGHLLSREAVQHMYAAKRFDLRASLVELNLFCQMGVGDNKGGLEWMPIDKPAVDLQTEDQTSRVVSKDTYCSGMGWLGGEDLSDQTFRTPNEVTNLCADVWNAWNIDIGAADMFIPTEGCQSHTVTREDPWHALQTFDKSCEALSAADILPASITRHQDSIGHDLHQPDLTERSRCNYTEGQRLLQTDPLVDFTGTSEAVAITLRASAITSGNWSDSSTINMSEVMDVIPQMLPPQQSDFDMSKLKLLSTFDPISNYSSVTLGVVKGPSTSIFDGPISLIMTDVAPFVRAIVSYDLRLESQRRQLKSLLAQPGAENNKTRTTRASRAALEGGSKASTRRERWFAANTDFDAVLHTGGREWQELALQKLLEQLQTMENGEWERKRSSSDCASVQDMSN